MSWLDFAKKYNDSYPLSYYDNNGGFHIYIKTYYMLGLGGWTQDAYDIIGLADGFTRVDYSLSLASDYSDEGVTPIYVEAGIDVESLKYAVCVGAKRSHRKSSSRRLTARSCRRRIARLPRCSPWALSAPKGRLTM